MKTWLARLRRRPSRHCLPPALAFLLALLATTPPPPAAAGDASSSTDPLSVLDRYVAAPDTNFTFRLLETKQTPAGKMHVLEMVSQAWLTTNEVNHPLWRHWLSLAVPNEVTARTALLFITGGSNEKGPPKSIDGTLAQIAVETKSVVAELRNVPNQPLIFLGDGQKRSEDDLIGYTWDKFLRTGDARWPARLPMTKAAVRAMDAVTAFCATPEGGGAKVERFVVAGASKRGWTTWTTAAVDRRVVAIAPIVIDVLNVDPSMRHHYAAYGFWAPAVHDYVEHDVMSHVGTPQFAALMQIEDPYSYRQRFTMPKLILCATGDQFFLPDSSQYYFDELPGPKCLRYVPNADHSLKDTDAWLTLRAFYQSVLAGASMPRFGWTLEQDGAIAVKAVDRPREVRLWQATNPQARDFRLETLGPCWTNSPLRLENGACVARVPDPPKGWTAFLVELTYDGPGGQPLKLTTQVRVRPDKTDHEFAPRPVR
jgi:PhoPQ-activated pathogenicity-related protein